MKTPTFILSLILLVNFANAQYHFVYDSTIRDYKVYVDSSKSISKVDTFKCFIGYQGSDREHFTDGFALHGHYLTWDGKRWNRSDRTVYLDANFRLVQAVILHHVEAPNRIEHYHRHTDSSDYKLYDKKLSNEKVTFSDSVSTGTLRKRH